jgi:hypothetical protein
MTILNEIQLIKQSEPAAPPAGEIVLYVGLDGVLYAKDSIGMVHKITS